MIESHDFVIDLHEKLFNILIFFINNNSLVLVFLITDLLLLFVRVFGRTDRSFFLYLMNCYCRHLNNILGHNGKKGNDKFSINLNFFVWEYYMLYALEEITMVEVSEPKQAQALKENVILHFRYLRNECLLYD